MKFLILTQILFFTLIQIQDVKFIFPTNQQEIFSDYVNKNFSQKLSIDDTKISVEIMSSNPLFLELNFRIFPNKAYINKLDLPLKQLILELSGDRILLKEFLQSISSYLKENISYTKKETPQDPLSVVLNKEANCIGFCNLVSLIFKTNGIKTRFIRGFYLSKKEGKIFSPIPHRWLEIQLADGNKYFYDPQYQNFSANYIKVKEGVDFKNIRKFEVYLVRKSKKIIN